MAKKKVSKAKPTPKVTKTNTPPAIKGKKEPVKKSAPVKVVVDTKKKKQQPAPAVKKTTSKNPTPKSAPKKEEKKTKKAEPVKVVPKKSVKSSKGKPVSTKKSASKKKSAPTKKSRKKNKGSTDYQKLKKYLLDRYKRRTNIVSDKDASQTARSIYNFLKINGRLRDNAITHKLLREALNELFPQEQKMFGRKRVPEIPDKYQIPNEFYNIEEVLQDHKRGLFRRVWIYSPLILGKKNNGYVFLNPDKNYAYDETFQGWVDYINELINAGQLSQGSPPEVWYKFNDVFWNSRRKRFEVSIIPCDGDGNLFNTGYIIGDDVETDTNEQKYGVDIDEFNKEKEDAKKKVEELSQPVEEQKQPIQQPAQEPKEVTEAKIRTELEREKSFKIQSLVQAKQSVMDDIRFNKEIGEPYDDLMIKLKNIRAQIDKLIQ